MMFSAFLLTLRNGLRLLWWSLVHLFGVDLRAFPKRLLLFTLGLPLFVTLQAVHWLGFLLDELLFPAYRHVAVERPLFIVGIPRSGTTFLQRTLAEDDRFTTTAMWECLLAPSITERMIYRGLGRLLAPLKSRLPSRTVSFFSQMEAIHELGLQEPEEDFLLLLPVFACFILIVVFPEAEWLWRLAYFDERLSEREKEILLGFYRRCVQKHLYVHGGERRYLSKNPSFSSLITGLTSAFPDGQIVVTVREPAATVPSQLSSLRPALALIGSGTITPRFQNRIIDMLHGYYRYFGKILPRPTMDSLILTNQQLKNDLKESLIRIYHHIDLILPADFARFGDQIARDSATYKSRHRYQLADFGLDKATIAHRFDDVWPLPAAAFEQKVRKGTSPAKIKAVAG